MRAPMSRCPESRPPPAEISLPYKNVCHGGYFVDYTDSPSGAAGRQATVTARQTATTERRQADGRQEKSDCGMSSIHSWLRRIGLDHYTDDRKSDVSGKSVEGSVVVGGGRVI